MGGSPHALELVGSGIRVLLELVGHSRIESPTVMLGFQHLLARILLGEHGYLDELPFACVRPDKAHCMLEGGAKKRRGFAPVATLLELDRGLAAAQSALEPAPSKARCGCPTLLLVGLIVEPQQLRLRRFIDHARKAAIDRIPWVFLRGAGSVGRLTELISSTHADSLSRDPRHLGDEARIALTFVTLTAYWCMVRDPLAGCAMRQMAPKSRRHAEATPYRRLPTAP
ncbi:hypothetical protein D9M72_451470 [compost metagenome]